jgi:hypothetical protein
MVFPRFIPYVKTALHIAAFLIFFSGMAFLLLPSYAHAQVEETRARADSLAAPADSAGADAGLRVPATGVPATGIPAARIPLRLSPDDSLVTGTQLLTADSLLADSLRMPLDSLSLWARSEDIDTIITYKAADSVVYVLGEKRMYMYDEAAIDYGKTAIRAARITINWDNSTIEATGVPDSSAGGKLTGTPMLKEGEDKYTGEAMTFNFKTEKGVITQGETAIDDGFYLGERIKRISPDEYFIGGGRYTTCDNPDHKHYYFGSAEMKFVPNEVVVARPITFYVEDIPLLWLPFAVIPTSKGRSSGIIVPSFGESATRGRYLLRGGYYLVMSDYWDLALTGDVYSKGGYLLRSDVRYAMRYNFTGSVSATYGRQTYNVGNVFTADDQAGTDWSLTINHDQEIDPTSRISVDFSFSRIRIIRISATISTNCSIRPRVRRRCTQRAGRGQAPACPSASPATRTSSTAPIPWRCRTFRSTNRRSIPFAAATVSVIPGTK